MTGADARILSKRLELHLRKNDFSVCQEILDSAEEAYLETVQQDEEGGREITTIAELRSVPLRVVHQLEKEGYLYLKDLDGVDVENLHKDIYYLGEKHAFGLSIAVEKAREHNELVRRRCIAAELLAEQSHVKCPIIGTR